MSKLSELARTYLEHLDAINAGWAALNADIPLILQAVTDQLSAEGQPVSCPGGVSIERAWPASTAGLSFRLRLLWSPGDPLRPRLTLNETVGHDEIPEPLKHLLDRALLASWRGALPSIDLASLQADPLPTLLEAWSRGVQAVEAARDSAELETRLRGYALLTAVSNRVGGESDALVALQAQLARRPGDVLADEGWPAYVQVDWVHNEMQYAWDLVYVPTGPRLWLVLYDGRNLRRELPLATAVRYQDRFPILGDFTSMLDEPNQETAANTIVSGWISLIERLRRGAEAGGEPGVA
jgi:hypothetical protein